MLPVACRRYIHLIAELGLTSNQSAASRRDAPDSTAFITRSRNSKEHGLGIDPPSITRINAARFAYASPPGNPDSIQPKLALAIRAEVHAEQAIRNTAAYLRQKTAELHALNRSLEDTRMRLITQIDQLQELKAQLDFNPAAVQNNGSLVGAQASLEQIHTYTADAQKLASELDKFGSTRAAAARLGDQGKSVEVIKRR